MMDEAICLSCKCNGLRKLSLYIQPQKERKKSHIYKLLHNNMKSRILVPLVFCILLILSSFLVNADGEGTHVSKFQLLFEPRLAIKAFDFVEIYMGSNILICLGL